MKQSESAKIRLPFLIAVLVCGCGKTLIHSDLLSLTDAPAGSSYFTNDSRLSPFYGDSVLTMQSNDPSGYLFAPLNKLGQGSYVSWPGGLTIDPQTGVIDLSKTEPGARYNIGFINAFTHDTAYRQLVIAGVGYLDGIYDMSAGDTLLNPYFNANPLMSGVCNSSDGTDYPDFSGRGYEMNGGDNKCRFDCDRPIGLRANDQRLKVRTISGVIDLKKSLQQGVFGADLQNGATRQMTVYYRINDQSHMSLQKTSIILHYYQRLSDVPDSLISLVNHARAAFLQNQVIDNQAVSGQAGSSSGGGHDPVVYSSASGQSGTGSKLSGSSSGSTGSTPTNVPPTPRPPHVVIVNVGR